MLLHIYRKVKKNTSVSANILEKGKVVSAGRQNIYFYLGYTEQGSDFNFVQNVNQNFEVNSKI